MNRRNGPRKDEVVSVWLYRGDNLIAMARTENINSHGVYIKTNSLLFPKDSNVDLVFADRIFASGDRLNARVVHRNLNGIGVVFSQTVESEAIPTR